MNNTEPSRPHPPAERLLINLPPPRRGQIVRSWVMLNLAAVAYFLPFLLICVFPPKRPLETGLLVSVALPAAVSLVCSTFLYLPRFIRWPRRDRIIELTGEKLIVTYIDPWSRLRREWPVSAIRRVWSSFGVIGFSDGRKLHGKIFGFDSQEAKAVTLRLKNALRPAGFLLPDPPRGRRTP